MSNSKKYLNGEDLEVPVHLNFGKFILDKLRGRTNKDDIAMENIDTNQKLSYKEMIQYAVNLSASLTKLGVGRGDVVGVGCGNLTDLFPIAFAILFTGATCTVFEVKIGKIILKHQLKISKPKYLISSKQFWIRNQSIIQDFDCIKTILSMDDPFDSILSIRELALNNVDVDSFEPASVFGQTDVAFIMFSSGTTGLSKGIQQTHLLGLQCCLPLLGFQGESINTAFIYEDWNGLNFYVPITFLTMGIKIVHPYQNPNMETIMRAIDQHNVNVAIILPPLIRILIKENNLNQLYNMESLKIIVTGTCCIHLSEMESIKRTFPNLQHVLQSYGMTETLSISSEEWSKKGLKPGSVGHVHPGFTLKTIVMDFGKITPDSIKYIFVSDLITHKAVGPNERGEITVKAPGLVQVYVGMDPSYGKDEEGFFKTGDLGYYDDDGYLYVVERLKEIICYDGNKIVPLEVENVLQMHSEVKDAAVVGKPDPDYEELPTAFVVRVLGSNVSEQELVDYVKGEVSLEMQLRGGVKFIEEIPRNLRGKILRQQLRNLLKED